MVTHATAADIARAIGVNPKTVARWAERGAIPQPHRGPVPGSRRRWSVDVAADIVRANGGTPPAEWTQSERAA